MFECDLTQLYKKNIAKVGLNSLNMKYQITYLIIYEFKTLRNGSVLIN